MVARLELQTPRKRCELCERTQEEGVQQLIQHPLLQPFFCFLSVGGGAGVPGLLTHASPALSGLLAYLEAALPEYAREREGARWSAPLPQPSMQTGHSPLPREARSAGAARMAAA